MALVVEHPSLGDTRAGPNMSPLPAGEHIVPIFQTGDRYQATAAAHSGVQSTMDVVDSPPPAPPDFVRPVPMEGAVRDIPTPPECPTLPDPPRPSCMHERRMVSKVGVAKTLYY